jgi:hypothetical protein
MSSARAEEIKKYGLFVVTDTYTTTKCSLTAWTDPAREVVLGFDVGVSGLGKVGPGVKWYEAENASGWNRHEASSVSCRDHPFSLHFSTCISFSPTSPFLVFEAARN